MNTPWETPPFPEDPRDDDEREQGMHAANARDAKRYRWLKLHIAPSIITRIDKHANRWPPEKLDELIDARLKPESGHSAKGDANA